MRELEELKHLLTQHIHLENNLCMCGVPVGPLTQDWADHVALVVLTTQRGSGTPPASSEKKKRVPYKVPCNVCKEPILRTLTDGEWLIRKGRGYAIGVHIECDPDHLTMGGHGVQF